MPPNFDELAALIRARFPEFSRQFQTGAAYQLNFPDEVAVSSMRKVAEGAKVQPAALVRLSQAWAFQAGTSCAKSSSPAFAPALNS